MTYSHLFPPIPGKGQSTSSHPTPPLQGGRRCRKEHVKPPKQHDPFPIKETLYDEKCATLSP